MADNKNNKKSALNSILFRSWISFVILAIGVIVAVWVGELVVFATLFRNMRIDQIEKTNEGIVTSLKNNDCKTEATAFRRAVDGIVKETGMTVIVFRFSENADEGNPYEADVLFSRRGQAQDFPGGELSARAEIPFDFLEKLNAEGEEGSVVYTVGTKPSFSVIVGEKIKDTKGQTVYYYSSSTVVTNDATVSVLASQFKTVSIICLIVSVLASFVIAWKLVKPVRNFTATAKKIGDGDLTVKYEGNGYNEFDELADALNYSTEEIIKTENLRRDFLANASHDLRTPLTLVKAYAEMIRDVSGDDAQKREKHTQIIINEVDRLTMLVDDILDLSKLQSGTVQMNLTQVDLGQLVERTVSQFEVMREKGYDVSYNVEEGAVVECDQMRMNQVVYNLIGNAINYVGEDKLVLIDLKKLGGKVRLSVTDHGKGIAEDEIDKVWDRYYRSNQNKRNVVGSGIGLSIVKSVLLSHGAEFGIISAPGEGTTFWFEMPLIEQIEENNQ